MKNLIDKWMAFIEDLVKEWPEKDISRTWIKVSNKALTIDSIANDRVVYAFGSHMNFDFIIKNYEFADGTPFGIKED